LSEQGVHDVLLIEAGPDFGDISHTPFDVLDARGPTENHDWGYASDPDKTGKSIPLPRGRLIGGCSATNACFALRGATQSYDSWAALGNPGWSYIDVLESFRKLEADRDFGDPWHGSDGPIPIRRYAPDELNPVQSAFIEAGRMQGLEYVPDHNRPGAVGIGPAPRNVIDGVRMSTALTYVASSRNRTNLEIRGNSLVGRVVFSGGRATGVELESGEVIDSEVVVIAAGAYASPALLMRSGVGPSEHLTSLGIDVNVPLGGVGQNLIDHPLVGVDFPTSPGHSGPGFQSVASVRSSLADLSGAHDLYLFAAGPFDASEDSPTGGIFGIVCGVMSPESRGSVRLRSRDAGDPPRIEVGHLIADRDVVRMIEAIVLARKIGRTGPLGELVKGDELWPGPTIGDDRGALEDLIRERVGTFHHPVGTCTMGTDPLRGAVVDSRCRVHGTQGLFVVDASVMPVIPTATTNLPTMMVAERVAPWILEDLQSNR
jgi:choline dehydrogenase